MRLITFSPYFKQERIIFLNLFLRICRVYIDLVCSEFSSRVPGKLAKLYITNRSLRLPNRDFFCEFSVYLEEKIKTIIRHQSTQIIKFQKKLQIMTAIIIIWVDWCRMVYFQRWNLVLGLYKGRKNRWNNFITPVVALFPAQHNFWQVNFFYFRSFYFFLSLFVPLFLCFYWALIFLAGFANFSDTVGNWFPRNR